MTNNRYKLAKLVLNASAHQNDDLTEGNLQIYFLFMTLMKSTEQQPFFLEKRVSPVSFQRKETVRYMRAQRVFEGAPATNSATIS